MIVGIGTDAVAVKRIEDGMRTVGESYLERVFSEKERAEARERPIPAEYYAGRFAVKEAVYKALHLPWGQEVSPLDIQTLTRREEGRFGAPFLQAGPTLNRRFQLQGVGAAHVSIAYENDLAIAFCVLERVAQQAST